MAKLGEMLIADGLLTKDVLDQALGAQRKDGGFLGAILLRMKAVTEEQLVEALTRQTGSRPVDLDAMSLEPDLAGLIPEDLARKFHCLPVKATGPLLHVALIDPSDDRAIEALSFRTGKAIKPLVAAPTAIERAWPRLYNGSAPPTKSSTIRAPGPKPNEVDKVMDGLIDDVKVVDAKDARAIEDPAFALDVKGDSAPVIRLVNGIIAKAIELRASDIHVEPFEHDLRIRYRVDGSLVTSFTLPASVKSSLVARMKIMSRLDIAEHRFPQDGRIKVQLGEGTATIDLRVSVLPSLFGEKVVIRVLGQGNIKDKVDDLGLSAAQLTAVQGALRNPYGMILVTGPTGSGKTTTLYTFLKALNTEDVNIVTAEDPVEYNLAGITQVPVRPAVGYSFDLALRAFLRQDPDVILVGEMRDFETAAIAVKAALTGHLVLSTLHTNDAPSTIVRLIDMGIEPYLVASAVKIVIAQRLVRRVCPACREEVPIAGDERAALDESQLEAIRKTFRGKGCPECHKTGYKGRVPVFEAMPVKSREMKRIITEAGTEVQVAAVARREDIKSLKDECLRLVNEGVTSLEEALGIIAAE